VTSGGWKWDRRLGLRLAVRNEGESVKKRSDDGLDETDFWIACTADAGLGPVITADLLAAILERVSRAADYVTKLIISIFRRL
jgi:hypothetical protein